MMNKDEYNWGVNHVIADEGKSALHLKGQAFNVAELVRMRQPFSLRQRFAEYVVVSHTLWQELFADPEWIHLFQPSMTHEEIETGKAGSIIGIQVWSDAMFDVNAKYTQPDTVLLYGTAPGLPKMAVVWTKQAAPAVEPQNEAQDTQSETVRADQGSGT